MSSWPFCRRRAKLRHCIVAARDFSLKSMPLPRPSPSGHFVTNKLSTALAAYEGKCILITGAGGFIGAALAVTLAESAPRFLLLLDNSEQNLYQVDMALRERGFAAYAPILGDVCDADLLEEILDCHRPEAVFHSAACKHVPLMERNPLAAIRTNAIGTWRLANAAARVGVRQLLLISTDKAVNPASVMGATKRIAELALGRLHGGQLRLQAVRLGNVLGSTGSVAPVFARQIAQGGPVTVTHPEVERYFFTLEEAIDIVLRTSALGPGTFIPKLPPPMKISELAGRMIRAARTAATAPVQVKFTELRPGDKLREQFVHDAESCESTQDALLQLVRGVKIEPQAFDAAMCRLQELVEQRNLPAVMDILCELVPGYRPSTSLLQFAHAKSVAKS